METDRSNQPARGVESRRNSEGGRAVKDGDTAGGDEEGVPPPGLRYA